MEDRIHDPSFKGAVHIHSRYTPFIAYQSNGEIIKRMLKEPFITKFCGMQMTQNNKLIDILDIKTQQLFVAGIINHFISYDKKLLDQNYYKRPKSYKKEYLETI